MLDDIYYVESGTIPLSLDLNFTNSREGKGHGVELAAAWQTSSALSFNFTSTWQDLELNNKDTAKVDLRPGSAAPTLSSPEHQAAIRTSYDFNAHGKAICGFAIPVLSMVEIMLTQQTILPSPRSGFLMPM